MRYYWVELLLIGSLQDINVVHSEWANGHPSNVLYSGFVGSDEISFHHLMPLHYYMKKIWAGLADKCVIVHFIGPSAA